MLQPFGSAWWAAMSAARRRSRREPPEPRVAGEPDWLQALYWAVAADVRRLVGRAPAGRKDRTAA